jgi:3-oxoacyl-[acyl-carrier-protein] synthase II
MDVVVTGLGLALSGVGSAADLLGPPAGTPDDDPVRRLKARGLRYKDRATKLALCAARDALTDSGLLPEAGEPVLAVPGERVGVLVSSNYGNVDTTCEAVATIAEQTYLGTSPMALPATASNVTASWLAITHGLRGANVTLCNGPTSGLDAMFWAGVLIRSGRISTALVVGVEPANEPVRHVTGGGDASAAPPLLDGAVALIVESAAEAARRGRTPLATVGPYARRGEPDAAVEAVRRAEPRPVGMWCADGGPVDGRPAVHDLTARFGDCSGALGVLQCAAGTAWLGGIDGADEAVLAVAGAGDSGGDDAAAAMLLTAWSPR